MKKEEFIDIFNNKQKIIKFVIEFLNVCDFQLLESRHGMEEGTISTVFREHPEIETKFDDIIAEESQKQFSRYGYFRVLKMLDRMHNIITSIDEDSKVVSQAANIISQYHGKIYKDKKEEESDDAIDKLWKEFGNATKR
jgi:hypothetical protein